MLDNDQVKGDLKIPLLVIGAIFIVTLALFAYKAFVENTSDYNYTLGVVTGKHSDSKGVARIIKYTVNNKKYQQNCFSKDCKSLNTLDTVLLKFAIDDPQFFIVITDYEITANPKAPKDGWENIPMEFRKTSN